MDSELEADQLIEAGLERRDAGDRDAAEGLLRRAAAARPGDPTALYLLGLIRFEADDAADAERLLAQVASLRPDHAQAQFSLAGVRHWRGDAQSAAAGYRLVLALEPSHLGARIGLSQCLLAKGDLIEAANAAGEAVRQAPGEAAARLALAAACIKLGWPQEALTSYAAAAQLAPEAAAAHAGLGLARLKLGDLDAARASAEQALALDAAVADAWFVLGEIRRALGDGEAAVTALERSVALDSSNPAFHLSLGLAYADLERPNSALGHLLKAVELEPNDKDAHVSLSALYQRGGRPDQSMIHARRALEIDPQMMAAHQNLAGLLAQEGREAEAQAHRNQAYSGGRSLLVVSAARPERRVLVLTTTTSGNTPDRHLLSATRFTRLFWFIEYATEAQMAELPPYDVVFSAIADPDYAEPTVHNVERFLATCERRVINDPGRIAQTARHLAPTLLAGLSGVVTPQTVRVTAQEAADGFGQAALRAGLVPPFLVRPIGSHGGEGLVLAEDQDAQILRAPPGTGDHYLTAFHDYRSNDGFYRKYRMFFVDRRPYPYHLAISANWMVHHASSAMQGDAARMAEEMRFLEHPEAAIGAAALAAVTAIGERIDLDFCGLDFSVLPDGRVLVFEANATMLAHPEAEDGPFAPKNPYVERIVRAFGDMISRI